MSLFFNFFIVIACLSLLFSQTMSDPRVKPIEKNSFSPEQIKTFTAMRDQFRSPNFNPSDVRNFPNLPQMDSRIPQMDPRISSQLQNSMAKESMNRIPPQQQQRPTGFGFSQEQLQQMNQAGFATQSPGFNPQQQQRPTGFGFSQEQLQQMNQAGFATQFPGFNPQQQIPQQPFDPRYPQQHFDSRYPQQPSPSSQNGQLGFQNQPQLPRVGSIPNTKDSRFHAQSGVIPPRPLTHPDRMLSQPQAQAPAPQHQGLMNVNMRNMYMHAIHPSQRTEGKSEGREGPEDHPHPMHQGFPFMNQNQAFLPPQSQGQQQQPLSSMPHPIHQGPPSQASFPSQSQLQQSMPKPIHQGPPLPLMFTQNQVPRDQAQIQSFMPNPIHQGPPSQTTGPNLSQLPQLNQNFPSMNQMPPRSQNLRGMPSAVSDLQAILMGKRIQSFSSQGDLSPGASSASPAHEGSSHPLIEQAQAALAALPKAFPNDPLREAMARNGFFSAFGVPQETQEALREQRVGETPGNEDKTPRPVQ